MQHVLITGGAGFIGATIAVGLRRELPGLRVTAFDNLRRRGAELALSRLRDAGVGFVHGDVRNAQDLAEAGPVDAVIECSAEPSVAAGYGTAPNYVLDTNLVGAINCFELARTHRAGVIFLSTSRVYPIAALERLNLEERATRFEPADEQSLPGVSQAGISEAFPLDGVRSLYGATKLGAELVLQEYAAMYEMPAVINRFGVVAGPWQMGRADQGFAALWVARHVYRKPLAYIGFGGTGRQVRDVLHVDDLVRLVRLQLEGLHCWRGEVFNAGGGMANSVSLCELTTLCREITGAAIPIAQESATRPADIPWYVTDHSRLTARTGWRPEKSIQDAVNDIHGWIQANRTALEPILGA